MIGDDRARINAITNSQLINLLLLAGFILRTKNLEIILPKTLPMNEVGTIINMKAMGSSGSN
jgi:hypothetical protein